MKPVASSVVAEAVQADAAASSHAARRSGWRQVTCGVVEQRGQAGVERRPPELDRRGGRPASVSAVTAGSVDLDAAGCLWVGVAVPTTSTGVSSVRLDLGEGGLVLDHDLRGAAAVAHHDEGQAGQPTAPVDPAAEPDRAARLVGVRRKVGSQRAGRPRRGRPATASMDGVLKTITSRTERGPGGAGDGQARCATAPSSTLTTSVDLFVVHRLGSVFVRGIDVRLHSYRRLSGRSMSAATRLRRRRDDHGRSPTTVPSHRYAGTGQRSSARGVVARVRVVVARAR